MHLYIMRHGDAIPFARTDAERPLSETGCRQAAAMASCFLPMLPARVIASPYLRAQQTCSIVCESLGIRHFDTVDGITPDVDPHAVVRLLQDYQHEESLLMVSHQPLVSTLIALLVDGSMAGGYMMGTASVACLHMDMLEAGQATLQWLRHAA